MKKYILTFSILFILVISSCRTPHDIAPTNAFANFETECLGVDLDGTQTLRAWGKGNNRAEAIEQAKRNAVRDVILKGITSGSGDCNKKPLVTEVNAKEKYEDYFNAFFRNGGAYNKYVKLDEKRTSRMRAKHSTIEQYGVVLTVDRAALRERLINDNVISK